MLNKDLIFVDVDCQSCEEVLRYMGGKFVEAGVAKESYPDALVARELKYPTGLPAGVFDIATPHTFKEHINRPGIGVGVLKNPVEWKQMGSPEITLKPKVIFMLAITDPKEQIGLLKKIMKLIQNKEALEKVAKATSSEEIYEILDPMLA